MLNRAREIEQQLINWRRRFHTHPELGFQEFRTAELVAETLRSLGLKVKTKVGKTGVVGYLGEGKPVVALRADMDALPIQEANDVPYASQVPGVMHACGHDAHTAILLGVAVLLCEEELPGQVRLLFQPAEEVDDEEGESGAGRMIEDGAMEGVDAVLSLHVDSNLPVGIVEIDGSRISASVDTFYATIMGKGCHGAYPHRGVDTIFILGQVINAIHGIVSRRIDPLQPAVISIGTVHGGQADNVIPDIVEISGTIRSVDEEVRRELFRELERALGVARALGGDFELRIEEGIPACVNNPRIASLIRQVAIDLLGADCLHPPEPGMGGEDFALLANLAPGAMFGLGTKGEGGGRTAHSPTFDIDERALPIGAAILAEAARRYLVDGG
ncbi:MAG: amidohydrolase [Anaerolineae bacterium]